MHGVRSGQQGGGAAARRAGQPVQRHVRRGSYAPGPAGGQASGGGTCGRSGGGPGRGTRPMAAAWRPGTAGSACSAPQARRRQLQRAAAGRRRSGPPGTSAAGTQQQWKGAAAANMGAAGTRRSVSCCCLAVGRCGASHVERTAVLLAPPALLPHFPLPLPPAAAACRLTQQRGSHGVQA